MDDAALLNTFSKTGNADAFSAIVERYLDLVYSAARRQLRDPHLAEDVAQAVFMILARRARRLKNQTILAGWLYNTTRYASANALRSRRRRQTHERAAAMTMNDAQTSDSGESTDPLWDQLSPMVDDAMAQLNPGERDAILLKYFHAASHQQIGASAGISETAAAKRLSRGLAKLRQYFAARGVTAPLAAIESSLLARAVQPAGRTIAKSVCTAAANPSAAPRAATIAKATSAGMSSLVMNIATAGLAACLLAGTGVFVMQPRLAGTMPSTAPVAQPGEAGRWSGVIPAGGSVELIGVAAAGPGTDPTWWKPDGTPLGSAPYADPAWQVTDSGNGPQGRHFQFALRFNDVKTDRMRLEFSPEIRDIWGNPKSEKHEPIPDMINAAVVIPSDAKTVSLHVPISAKLWKTFMTISTDGAQTGEQTFAKLTEIGNGQGEGGGAVGAKSHLRVAFTWNAFRANQFRCIAVLKNGKQVESIQDWGSSVTSGMERRPFFANSIDEVDHFEYQMRPFTAAVKFSTISLSPQTKTVCDVSVQTIDVGD